MHTLPCALSVTIDSRVRTLCSSSIYKCPSVVFSVKTGWNETERAMRIAEKGGGGQEICHFKMSPSCRKTHGDVTLHQPPALLVHKTLLNCNDMSIRTASTSVSSLSFHVCVLVASLHGGMTQKAERSLARPLTESDS